MNSYENYTNGYLARKDKSYYLGELSIDRIDISPIEATFFEREDETYLWMKRRPILEYDGQSYKQRLRRPHWECYLKKKKDARDTFEGAFIFMRFKYTIIAQWDATYDDKFKRMNIYVERLPMEEQTIINNIRQRQ